MKTKHWTEYFTEKQLIYIAHQLVDRIEVNLKKIVKTIKNKN